MTSPTDPYTVPAEELELLKAWAFGERPARQAANAEIDRRMAARQMSRAGCRIRGIMFGPGHRARKRRAGRRLAFSFAYLIATTRPAVVEFIRRVGPRRVLVRNVSGRPIGAHELVTIAPPAEGRGPAAGPTRA